MKNIPNHDPLPNPLRRKKSKTKSSNPYHDHDPPIKNKIKKKKKNPLNHNHNPPKEGRHGGEIQQPSYNEIQKKSSHTTIDPQSTTKLTKIHCHKPTTTAKIHHHQTHKPLNPKPTLNMVKPTAWVGESEELKRE